MPVRGPRLKTIRRLGTPLPGLTRKTPTDPVRPATASQRGPRRRITAFRRRLEEKQKLRFHYGVSERQLRRYLDRVRGGQEVTGTALLSLLERRLDNVVFRLGLAPTIAAARQLVAHGHIRLNGRRVDRPAHLVSAGDVVAASDRARRIPGVADAVARGPEVRLPGYVALDPADPFAGRVVGVPARGDIPFIVDDSAIIEFYAR